jgi:hypothetical protein
MSYAVFKDGDRISRHPSSSSHRSEFGCVLMSPRPTVRTDRLRAAFSQNSRALMTH